MHDPLQPPARRTPAALRRRSALVAAAGFLAVVLIAAACTLAHALPWPGSASRAATGADSRAATAGIDAGLDTAINGIIGANGGYQVGVALLDTDGGDLHQYGVEQPFEAASTAKILTAAAYYSLVEDGLASLDDPLGAYTSGFQIQAMVQDSNNDSWSLLMDAVPDSVTVFHKYGLLDDELHDAAILSSSDGTYVLVVYTKGAGLSDVPQRTAVIHEITEAVTAALF